MARFSTAGVVRQGTFFFILLLLSNIWALGLRPTAAVWRVTAQITPTLGCGLPRTVRARDCTISAQEPQKMRLHVPSCCRKQVQKKQKSPTQGSLCLLPRSGAVLTIRKPLLLLDVARDLRFILCRRARARKDLATVMSIARDWTRGMTLVAKQAACPNLQAPGLQDTVHWR